MEILSKLIEVSSKRLQLENLCGLKLNDYQIDVLMNESNENIIEYEKQPRRRGTTTALLLKVYKDVILDRKTENVMIISDGNLMSIAAHQMFNSLLRQSNSEDFFVKNNRYECITKNNVVIKFVNKNIHNLIGIKDYNFYVDDYREGRDDELLNICRYSYSKKIYLF